MSSPNDPAEVLDIRLHAALFKTLKLRLHELVEATVDSFEILDVTRGHRSSKTISLTLERLEDGARECLALLDGDSGPVKPQ